MTGNIKFHGPGGEFSLLQLAEGGDKLNWAIRAESAAVWNSFDKYKRI